MLLHREEVKARLRMKYGTLGKFEQEQGLPPRSVNDIFQGKTARRTAEAVASELGVSIHWLFPGRYAEKSAKPDTNERSAAAHSLNAEVN